MTRHEQIYRWLKIGFRQPTNRLEEIFYYDKRDNQFFSVLLIDYFMLDENFDIAPGVTTSYSKETVKIIAERIKRVENNDSSIFSLPRFGASSNDELIIQKIESFLNLSAINLETVNIWEIEEDTSIYIDLKNDIEPKAKSSWWKIWK